MSKPNIVLINCDDLGYGDIGCYGSKLNRTPAVDHMAENGLLFTDFYMASPICTPSRGAMMTGCYPTRIGFGTFEGNGVLFPGQGMGLSQSEVTIADVLKSGGYRTKLIGKWHCGDQPGFLPLDHGFDEFYGLPYSNDLGVQKDPYEKFNLPHHRKKVPLPLMEDSEVIEEQPDQCSLTERYVERATSFIRKNKDRPFFLYMAHMHVHLPLYAPEVFVKNSQNGDYGACVEEIDWSTKCILHELEKQGLTDNTIVIFTSDNGSNARYGGSNAPLSGAKLTTWEGGLRVPCVFYWPGHIRKGVCKDIVSSIDFLPTFAKLCGIDYQSKNKIDGMDFSSLLFDENAKSPRDTFYYYYGFDLHGVRWGDWKLRVREFAGYDYDLEHMEKGVKTKFDDMCELYHLREDVAEEHDVSKDHPDIVERMQEMLAECRQDLGDQAKGFYGDNVRPIGRVENPVPLTEYDENHPYIIKMYDREDIG
ncbi:MAG TPA: sulfatase-like hydrolase/transferase [Clostridiales bacterium]|nr:sulfatase-like hydrolase/transferase [Clostridiales bacterium]